MFPRPLLGADEPGPAPLPRSGSLPPAGPVRIQRLIFPKTNPLSGAHNVQTGGFLVREKRVELSTLSELVPKTSASAISATPAWILI